MKKNCQLTMQEQKSKKNGKTYKVMYIELPSGFTFQVKYAFYNYKLDYRVQKELEELNK